MAQPYIIDFELRVAALKSLMDGEEVRGFAKQGLKYPVGETDLGGGKRVIASQTHYMILEPGLPPVSEPNIELTHEPGGFTLAQARFFLSESPGGGAGSHAPSIINPWTEELKEPAPEKPKPKSRDDGAVLIQHWIDDLGIKPPIQREAWRTWKLFQELSGEKRLSEITRDDATKLRHHMLEVLDLASNTVAKNCGHLRAAFKHAESVHGYKGENPFASLISKKLIANRADEVEGESYSEEEMAIVRADLDNWRDDARLLWVLCATTGMRAGEAFLIKGERTIEGVRCVNLRPTLKGETIKTPQSKRWLPLPKQVLPFIPSRIEGPLFERSQSAVLHWVNRRLAKLGLARQDSAKSLKSLRHRAVERLNTARNSKGMSVPVKVPEQITGHALEGVHNKKYFKKRDSMPVLKEWIDLIGY
ncbi:tyrosine-type recombinase/integrase [Methylorubrum extorquens]|uniref:tyrosine-type recombinase/integrase n=1 Tax=Methylorubrum extorquens TaxID=408 RepID=UPI003F60A770